MHISLYALINYLQLCHIIKYSSCPFPMYFMEFHYLIPSKLQLTLFTQTLIKTSSGCHHRYRILNCLRTNENEINLVRLMHKMRLLICKYYDPVLNEADQARQHFELMIVENCTFSSRKKFVLTENIYYSEVRTTTRQ